MSSGSIHVNYAQQAHISRKEIQRDALCVKRVDTKRTRVQEVVDTVRF
jgi:hypothetical protein